jgi:ElaB/YqjD/DUF883 family membrane-anchored ribosome-binding protein
MSAQIPSQVTSLPNAVGNAVGQATDTIAQEANRFGELARAWWSRNADLLRDTAGTMRDEAAAFSNRTRLYVKDEPVKSVLVAAAVGAALTGLLVLIMKRDH